MPAHHSARKLPALLVLLVLCASLLHARAHAQSFNSQLSASPPQLLSISPEVVSVSGPLVARIANLENAGVDPASFRLRLDGHRLDALRPEHVHDGEISFDLAALHEDRPAWLALVERPPFAGIKQVRVDIATPGRDLATASGRPCIMHLLVFSKFRLAAGLLAIASLWAAIIGFGASSNMLRDASPVAPNARRPYSLARCQMAFWFLLITTSFVAVLLVTGDYNGIVTSQSLALMGIPGLTGLAAARIDDVKSRRAGAPASANAVHQSFWTDLLTDDTGWAFHRVQIVAWTLILGAVSLWSVWDRLTLPDFDNELLILMGLSSGLYLGFKWPEQQTSSDQKVPAVPLAQGALS